MCASLWEEVLKEVDVQSQHLDISQAVLHGGCATEGKHGCAIIHPAYVHLRSNGHAHNSMPAVRHPTGGACTLALRRRQKTRGSMSLLSKHAWVHRAAAKQSRDPHMSVAFSIIHNEPAFFDTSEASKGFLVLVCRSRKHSCLPDFASHQHLRNTSPLFSTCRRQLPAYAIVDA